MVATYINNPEILREAEKIISDVFKETKSLVNISNDIGFENSLHKINIYTDNSYKYFLSYPNGIFMDDELLDHILEDKDLKKSKKSSLKDLIKVQNYAQRSIKSTIMVNANTIINNLLDKKVSISNMSFDLTDNQLNSYVESIIEGLRSDKLNDYYVFNITETDAANWKFNDNIICTKNLYAIKRQNFLKDDGSFSYVYSSDEDIRESLLSICSHIQDKSTSDIKDNIYLAQLTEAGLKTKKILEGR